MNPIDCQIDTAIKEYSMLDEKDKIIVGFSGGADSVVLLHYLRFALSLTVVAVHINHNLRGQESERDQRFVVTLCREWGVPCHVISADINALSKERKIGLEEAGRIVRYEAFERVLQEEKADKIATAHTLSDNIETLLLNLSRGCALDGLCGISPRRGNIIRPLIYCTREDIESYCATNKLSFMKDSTNSDDSYSRNNIRKNVIPVLKQINPSFELVAGRTIKSLIIDRDYLNTKKDSFYERNQGQDNCYDISAIIGNDKAVRTRIISDFLSEKSLSKSNGIIEKIDLMLLRGKGKIEVTRNKFIEVKNNRLIFDTNKPIEYFEIEAKVGETLLPTGEKIEISVQDVKKTNCMEKIYRNLLYVELDYDTIIGKLLLRQRRVGDKVEFSHRKGTKEIKKLFIDEKMSRYDKSKTIVLSDDAGVLGVVGYGVAKRCVKSENTKRLLVINKVL